jgi:heme/copper-type cytochrome/quinol oxidase subunit 2
MEKKTVFYILGSLLVVLIIIGTTIGLVVYFKSSNSDSDSNKQNEKGERR